MDMDMDMEKDIPVKNGELKKNYLVTQSNEIIEAMYQVGLTAKKLMVSIISQIEPEDEDFKYYMIPVADWKKLVGVTNGKRDYFDVLVKAATELRTKSITIDMRDKTKVNLGLVSAVKDDKKRQMVGARFDSELKPYLLNLRRNFTSFSLENVMKMRSVYSIRLYEILKSQRDKGIQKWTTALDSLRLKLGVEDMYSNFSGFRSRVLDSAKREIPQKTDLRFDYKVLKEGRKISDIDFFIYSVPKNIEVKGLLPELLKKIPEKSIKESEAICRKILKEKGEACLTWLIEYTNSKNYGNYGAYLRFAYANSLYDKHLEEKRLEEMFLKEQLEVKLTKENAKQKEIQANKNAREREAYLNELINNLSHKDKEELNKLSLKRLELDAETNKAYKRVLDRYLKYFNSNNNERAIKCLYQYRLQLIEDFIANKKS